MTRGDHHSVLWTKGAHEERRHRPTPVQTGLRPFRRRYLPYLSDPHLVGVVMVRNTIVIIVVTIAVNDRF
jgi:hypothetical protein